MSVHDERQYPWLIEEKRFITRAIEGRKHVVGICLGAQLIAEVCGAKVYPNEVPEIGWFEVSKTAQASLCPAFTSLPESFWAFHWHGETFEIPTTATELAESRFCSDQAFALGTTVLALQFHLEYSADSIIQMLANCGQELSSTCSVQSPQQILSKSSEHLHTTQKLLVDLLDRFTSLVPAQGS